MPVVSLEWTIKCLLKTQTKCLLKTQSVCLKRKQTNKQTKQKKKTYMNVDIYCIYERILPIIKEKKLFGLDSLLPYPAMFSSYTLMCYQYFSFFSASICRENKKGIRIFRQTFSCEHVLKNYFYGHVNAFCRVYAKPCCKTCTKA